MRVVAEYIETTNQVLVRLLNVPSILGDLVQTGTYKIDGTPQIPGVLDVDISTDDIKSGEAHILLTGYHPLPTYLIVTLPDLTEQRATIVKVQQYSSNWEPTLKTQPIDVITPIEPEDRRPGEGHNPYKPEATIPPEYPQLWMELSFERTDPVRLGADMVSEPVAYLGGCEGRALSSTQAQSGQDIAPYLSYAPQRLEGQFTNSLFNSDYSLDPSWPSPYFDPLPSGWSVSLADPMSLLRMQTTPSGSILPSFTLRFSQRTGSDISSSPPVTVLTPSIANVGETFQIIVAPAIENASGKIQLKTFDDAVASPIYNLTSGQPIVATLPIGTHTGRVKIIWDQQKGDGEEQIVQLVAPCSSVYTGSHSYIPTGKTSYADLIELNNVEFDKPWYFNKGTIRVDGSGDTASQPYSWKLKVGSQVLFQVDGGVLTSDFIVSAPVTLSSYLTSVLSYKLSWTSQTAFKIADLSGTTSISLPFSVDLTSIAGTTSALNLEIMGYKPNEGSAIAKRWAYLPLF